MPQLRHPYHCFAPLIRVSVLWPWWWRRAMPRRWSWSRGLSRCCGRDRSRCRARCSRRRCYRCRNGRGRPRWRTFAVEVAGQCKVSEKLEAGCLETDSHNFPIGLKEGAVGPAIEITNEVRTFPPAPKVGSSNPSGVKRASKKSESDDSVFA